MRRIVILIVMLVGVACRGERTYGSPVEALTEFPGYVSEERVDSVRVLAQREMPRGVVLLYAYEGTRPDVEGETCVATTFVSEERGGRWRAQSSGGMGCATDYPQPDGVSLAHTAGGNITELATVYGMAPGAATVRVQWVDGVETTEAVENGFVLVSRPETVMPFNVTVLDRAGAMMHVEQMR